MTRPTTNGAIRRLRRCMSGRGDFHLFHSDISLVIEGFELLSARVATKNAALITAAETLERLALELYGAGSGGNDERSMGYVARSTLGRQSAAAARKAAGE